MEIVIIGTGNTATILGRKLKGAGHNIVQVFGRDASAASALAYELDTESTAYWSVVNRNADIYILAVSDIAIAEIIHELQLPDKTIVHTAASVSIDVLQGATTHYGVLYPLQSLKKTTPYLPEIPVIIDASDAQTLERLEDLAGSISTQVVKAGDAQRAKLHLAAVFCNNFVNHLFVLMQQYCADEGLDFELLIPLIRETAVRIETITPNAAQTGPAIRHDDTTISKHLELLQRYPELHIFYQLFTQSIQQRADLS
jgi:predicted dinucleotide-binding enzyme